MSTSPSLNQHTSTHHDLENLARRMHDLPSDAAYRRWREAADQAQAEFDAAEQQLKRARSGDQRRKGAKQRTEAARQRHEHALSRRARVAALYAELRVRLLFHAGLPKDVAAIIHGGVGRARRQTACVPGRTSPGCCRWTLVASTA